MVSAVLLAGLGLGGESFAAPVPDTGQTKCYDDTTEITCPVPGEDYYGQDAHYLINPMAYTKMDADGNDLPDAAASWVMVRDNVTGLIWEIKTNKNNVKDYTDPHDADNTCTWYDSSLADPLYAGVPGDGTDTEDFIKALNDALFGNLSDWRLPLVEELVTLADFSIPSWGPTINRDFFPATQGSWYYTSITQKNWPGNAWTINFLSGLAEWGTKASAQFIRAVRGASLPRRFVDNGDGTVTDASVGLMWQQGSNSGNWKSALKACEDLTLNGFTDWRLPTIKELHSLFDASRFNPAIDEDYFFKQDGSFWSSTTVSKSSGDYDTAWAISGYNAKTGSYLKTGDNSVRAVRGGQKKAAGKLFITSPSQGSFWCGGGIMPITWDTAGLGGNVKISISTQGGKAGTFSTIVESTPNDGVYDWPVAASGSYNCVLRVEPSGDAAKATEQGLFTIIFPATRILNGPAECYMTIQEAYDAAINNDVIQAQAGFFAGNLFFDRNITVYLEGGYDTGYSSSTMGSGVQAVTISNGKAIFKNIYVK